MTIIEVSNETLRTLNPKVYTLIDDLENSLKQISDLDRSKWIVMPYEFTNGKYSLIFDPARLSNNSAVKKAGKELEINYKNSSEDSLGRKFIGKNNWYNSLKLNLALGNKTMSSKEFKDSLKLLYQGIQGKIKVYNNSGKQIDSKFLGNVFDDLAKVQSPCRTEWLDVDFKIKNEELRINYNHILDSNGNLVPKNSEILDEKTLMRNRSLGINLENYINSNYTKQGLPTKNVKNGSLYYQSPKSDKNSVAMFHADNSKASFFCVGNPFYAISYIGVRSCKAEFA